MAGNGELKRILRTGVADGPHRFWRADHAADFSEGRCSPERNLAHRFPHLTLEGGASDIQRKRKVFARLLDELNHSLDRFSCSGAIMPKLSAGKAGP